LVVQLLGIQYWEDGDEEGIGSDAALSMITVPEFRRQDPKGSRCQSVVAAQTAFMAYAGHKIR
jgi:hypothetical protein